MNAPISTQFLQCTPEEEEYFEQRDIQAREEADRKLKEAEVALAAAQAMKDLTYPHFLRGNLCPSQFGSVVYAAIREGKIPGIVLGGNHD